MEFVIELAKTEDAPAIIEARNKSFYHDYMVFGECPGYQIPLEVMSKRIQNGIVYKIMIDCHIIGDISVKIKENQYWLGCLEIIPEYQNMGIGTQAFQYIESLYPEAKCWGLETPVQSQGNCNFYEKLGFHQVKDTVISDKLTLRTFEKCL